MSFEDSPVDREWAPTQEEWEAIYPPEIMDIAKARRQLDYDENMTRIRLRCPSQRQADAWSVYAACMAALALILGVSVVSWWLWS